MIAAYRTFELPWELCLDQDERFQKILRHTLIGAVIFSVLMPLLPVPELDRSDADIVPQRYARFLLDKPEPPPPPPPKVEEVKPQPEQPVAQAEAKPEPKPVPQMQTTDQARERASRAGLLPFAEELAALRDNTVVDTVARRQQASGAGGDAPVVERALISSRAGTGSGGISTSGMSRNTGGGGLSDRDTTRVSAPVAGMGAGGPEVRSGGSLPSRSREEIELVFDQNKGAIYALYNRALRRDAMLQGKLVLKLTIEPSGTVSFCEVVSSELNDAELERKLVQRVKMFRFKEKDVAPVTTTKPIDFFPA